MEEKEKEKEMLNSSLNIRPRNLERFTGISDKITELSKGERSAGILDSMLDSALVNAWDTSLTANKENLEEAASEMDGVAIATLDELRSYMEENFSACHEAGAIREAKEILKEVFGR